MAKAYDRNQWIISANNAFYSNANLQPKQPIDFIPTMYRPPKQIKKVSVEEFFNALDGYKKRNKR